MLLVLISSISFAQVSPVKDDLHLLKTEEVKKLNHKLAAHKNHIGVVIKHSENIEEDALNYGREPHGVDVVVWYSPSHTDKEGTKHGGKIRIEVGTYKEGDLTDMSSNEIISKHAPLLREKKYYEFFDKVSDDIYQKLNEAPVKTEELTTGAIIVIVFVIICWVILYIICPDCAMFLLLILSLFGGKGSNGSFSGGGSTSKD